MSSASARSKTSTLGRKPCWKETAKGFQFNANNLVPDGKLKAALVQGLVPGDAKIVVSGKGTALRLPTLPFEQSPNVLVQLRNRHGTCWESTFSTRVRNDAQQFKAKSD